MKLISILNLKQFPYIFLCFCAFVVEGYGGNGICKDKKIIKNILGNNDRSIWCKDHSRYKDK